MPSYFSLLLVLPHLTTGTNFGVMSMLHAICNTMDRGSTTAATRTYIHSTDGGSENRSKLTRGGDGHSAAGSGGGHNSIIEVAAAVAAAATGVAAGAVAAAGSVICGGGGPACCSAAVYHCM